MNNLGQRGRGWGYLSFARGVRWCHCRLQMVKNDSISISSVSISSFLKYEDRFVTVKMEIFCVESHYLLIGEYADQRKLQTFGEFPPTSKRSLYCSWVSQNKRAEAQLENIVY